MKNLNFKIPKLHIFSADHKSVGALFFFYKFVESYSFIPPLSQVNYGCSYLECCELDLSE